jgi:hypothetical protein
MGTCTQCCGTGIAGHSDSRTHCYHCNGSGETVFVPCDVCGSEGRKLTMRGNDPDTERDHGPCPVCEGTGSIEVAAEVVEQWCRQEETLDDPL